MAKKSVSLTKSAALIGPPVLAGLQNRDRLANGDIAGAGIGTLSDWASMYVGVDIEESAVQGQLVTRPGNLAVGWGLFGLAKVSSWVSQKLGHPSLPFGVRP